MWEMQHDAQLCEDKDGEAEIRMQYESVMFQYANLNGSQNYIF